MILSIKDLILNNYENFILLWIIFAIRIFFGQWNTNFFTNFQRYFVKHLLPKYSLDILPLDLSFYFPQTLVSVCNKAIVSMLMLYFR